MCLAGQAAGLHVLCMKQTNKEHFCSQITNSPCQETPDFASTDDANIVTFAMFLVIVNLVVMGRGQKWKGESGTGKIRPGRGKDWQEVYHILSSLLCQTALHGAAQTSANYITGRDPSSPHRVGWGV